MTTIFLDPVVLSFLVCGVLAVVIVRSIVQTIHRRTEDMAIVGSDLMTRKLLCELTDESVSKRRTVKYDEIAELPQQTNFSRIVIADRKIQEGSEAAHALLTLKLRGVKIESAIESFERMSGRIWIEGISSEWLIFADGFPSSRFYPQLKRGLDLTMAILLLILTAPVMALIAILIKLDSAGPVIFKQERIGYAGSTFLIYKFRSMICDAETKTGPMWAGKNDDRATAVGSVLRRWRLDELPQIVNVLRGEMSFIGPRPERPYFVSLLCERIPYYDVRHYVKPGISGWAQVMYPYGASVEDAQEKLQYDLYYAKNLSFRLDVLILFKTLRVLFAGQGR
jgi:exopolysaccharide biosynthesis polyprenyl glycosylphosphotransferase